MIRTIGILGTGDMGSAVGRVFRAAGYRVVTDLSQRSEASQAFAVDAGFEDLGSTERLLTESDLFLSILPPAVAGEFARDAAALISASGRSLIYADCNAVAPASVQAIASCFESGPARFLDIGIVGPPPTRAKAPGTRFYVSGADRAALTALAVPNIAWKDMGEPIGRASAIKMCYAGMNKGVDALYANLLLAARRLGVATELISEFENSQAEAARRMHGRIPFLAATADRYTGEMAEIAAAFDAAGVSGDFYRGAEWLYAVLARSEFASETRATVPEQRSLELALDAFEAVLQQEAGTAS